MDGCRAGGLETAPRLLHGNLGSFHRRSIVLRSFPEINGEKQGIVKNEVLYIHVCQKI